MSIELTAHDYNSSLAQRLLAHLAERLDEQRRRNDAPMTLEKTEYTRGRIAEIKDLIGVLTPAPTE